MTETRTTFDGMPHWQVALWYALIAASLVVFGYGLLRLLSKYRSTSRPWRWRRPRVIRTLRIVVTHVWILRRAGLGGIAHVFVFYGFMVLLAGTIILGVQDDLARPVFGYDFFHGPFYLGYSLFLDVFGAVLLVGVLVFAVWRGIVRPFRLDYWRPDDRDAHPVRAYAAGDWTFLASLVFLGVTGFLLEAFRIAEAEPSFERWSPVGWSLGQLFRALELKGAAASDAHQAQWWVHGVAALAFSASVPYWKTVHMLTGPLNIAFGDDRGGRELPLGDSQTDAEIGYARLADFTPSHLLSLDACTRCGKCHAACPATAAQYPLSPRDVILDLRRAAADPASVSAGETIIGDPITHETIWSCMQCMACVDICPVGIEHVPIINQMRQALVDRGELDAGLQNAFEAIYTSGNSFGEPRRKRARWTKQLEFEVKDVRSTPAEYLWFVGDYASFDARNQRATLALARTLRHAGVDFGILWDAERTGGCDVRRAGEEALWTSLAEENIRTLDRCDFETIVSSDPHTFHTLRNEYPALGGDWPVVHHSQLLAALLAAGALEPLRPLRYRVTYHDPCTLGRYNGVYDAPRRVLRAIGVDLVEMPRTRSNSFCCGAGGGRIWMKEPAGVRRRPSELRIDEAVALNGLDYFVVACPKDVTMFEDAIKTSGHADAIELRELSELVWEAVAPSVVGAESVVGAGLNAE